MIGFRTYCKQSSHGSSSEDIRTGKQWLTEISAQLESTSYGILCITPDAAESPWLNFEAGALSKRVKDPKTAVVGVLFGIKPGEVRGPVSQFQNLGFSKDGMFKLIADINSQLEMPVDANRVKNLFEKFWEDLKVACEKHLSEKPATLSKTKTDREVLDEILARLKLLEDNQRQQGSRSAISGILGRGVGASGGDLLRAAVERATSLSQIAILLGAPADAKGDELIRLVPTVAERYNLVFYEYDALLHALNRKVTELSPG